MVEAGGSAGPDVRLGPALSQLAAAIRLDVVRLARPYLQSLFEATHETVDISQVQGRQVQFLEQIVLDRALRAVPRSDARFSLHCMANGKALLAAMSDAEVAGLLGPNLAPATSRSITSLNALLAELADVCRSGFAYDREELSDGICAVGTGITLGRGQAFAVSVAIPAQRFQAVLPDVRSALLKCRESLEAVLQAAAAGEPEDHYQSAQWRASE